MSEGARQVGRRRAGLARLLVVEAGRGLLRYKLRSGLSVLGITIGVAAVVWVVAIGRGAAERSRAQLASLGDNLVWLEAGARNVGGVRTGSQGMHNLLVDDYEAILRDLPGVVARASPQVDATVQVIYGDHNWQTRGRGVAPAYLDVKRWTIASGSPFTDEDVERASNVCLLGETVRRQLFGDESPLGESVRVQGQLYVVVGVLGAKGQSQTGHDQDDTIFLPWTTLMAKVRGGGWRWVDDVVCSATSAEAVPTAAAAITALMRQRHHIAPGADDDFNLRRPDAVIKSEMAATATLTLMLIVLASVSLLVGGIGVMNVMLASVTQRRREIGLRLAIGARTVEIEAQFLGEAVLLTLFGGLAGIGVSALGTFAISEMLGWPLPLAPEAIAVAVGVSALVGILFGVYPARRAARLDPIEALRSE